MGSTSNPLTPKQVVDDIRRGFVDESGNLIKSSANQIAQDALEGYAHDLNAEVAHFLEEMIQNFDDAEYNCPKPTVTIKDHGTHLLVTTNEKGMNEANVRAICTIRRGTKVNSSNNIGEKGIGFKTTFKAANKVWIRSGGYTFSLDRNRHLGMAIPIWEDFPQHLESLVESDKTQFLLEYRDQTRANDVRQALPKFDSKILLFLRQLREINIIPNAVQKRTVSRQDFKVYGGTGTELKTIENGKSDSTRFLIQKETAACTPPSEDRKRHGVTSSEVTVALPFTAQQSLPCQNAHNFLPIRMTNFKFLINADFKLLQNRADLDGDPENVRWNSDLMKGLAKCFVAAIKRMNQHDITRLQWLRLLPIDTVHGSFEPLRASIKYLVETEPLLLSAGGSYTRGDQLLYVPAEFRKADKVLFFHPPNTNRSVLSTIYDGSSMSHLRFLRVTDMNRTSFLESFRAFVTTERSTFQARGTEWHAALAEKLITYRSSDLAYLPIVPLTNGHWKSSKGDIYFSYSDKADQFNIPFAAGSLGEISFVAKSACLDASWRRLMTHLGVEPLDKSKICAKIKEVHDGVTAPSKDPEALLSHALFLFECNTRSVRRLWVENSRDEVVPAYQTYMDNPDHEYPVSELLSGGRSEDSILNPRYLAAITGDRNKEWWSYLRNELQVSTGIRLIFGRRNHEVMSKDLKYVIKNHSAKVFLSVIVQGWSQIQHLLGKSSLPGFTMPDESGFILQDVKVGTQRHGLQPLKDTALPLESLQALGLDELKLLDIDMSKQKDWSMLDAFGVTCSDNVLDIQLMLLRRAKAESASRTTIFEIYKKIQTLGLQSDTNKKQVIEFFAREPYIYYPPNETWHTVQKCVWSSSFLHIRQKRLEDHYVDCAKLCREILGISEATFDTFLAAVKAYDTPLAGEARKFLGILATINQQIRGSPKNLRQLVQSGCMSMPLIPLERCGEITFEPLNGTQQYLLNDRESYNGVFDDSCWQVKCSPSTARSISDLFKPTGFLAEYVKNEHRVSVCVKEDVVCTGSIRIDTERTEWLTEKIPFLKALASSENADSKEFQQKLERFQNATVCHVDSIEVRPYHEITAGLKVYGKYRPGTVSVDPEQPLSDHCKIYVDAKLEGIKGQASFFGEIDCQLAEYLRISEPSRRVLLKEIITASSDAKCIELLRLKGINITKAMLDQRPKQKPKSKPKIFSPDTENDIKHTENVSTATEATTHASMITTGFSTLSSNGNVATFGTSQPVSTKSFTGDEDEKLLRTGMKGELFIYKTLKEALGTEFSEANWTSELRNRADPTMSKWERPDSRDYADITIRSRSEKFLAWLAKYISKDELDTIRDATKYHIEIKTTNGGVNEPFHLSNIQWNHLRALSLDDDHNDEVYILVRVYRLASNPQIHVVVDPFECCHVGDLKIEGVEGIVCTISRQIGDIEATCNGCGTIVDMEAT